jgi:hypothetical protein
VPFDVRSRLEMMHARQVGQADKAKLGEVKAAAAGDGTAAAAGEPKVTAAGERGAAVSGHAPNGPAGPPTAAVADGAGSAGREEPAAPPAATSVRGLLRGRRSRGAGGGAGAAASGDGQASYDRPAPSLGVSPIGSIHTPGRATVEGRVRAVEIRPVERNSVLACEISDSTGDLTALFYGRAHIPGITCGSRVRFRGPVGIRGDGPVMINPAYELLSSGEESGETEDNSS